ncbi:MAG TPA: ATP-dependent DNA helicase [Acidimicrobiales bacterium]|nr:ATP-dependent DNA helicase [Acidimicrobiales bacterium]
METATAIELTDEQRIAVSQPGNVRIQGLAGTGKTTTLLARYIALLGEHPASELLVICRSRAGAQRFRDTVLGHLAGGFESLPITTFTGVAFDINTRHGKQFELITREEQVDEVARLLAHEGATEWPTLHGFIGRRAFVEQVAGALVEMETRLLSADDVRGRSTGWNEMAAFASRYQTSLVAAGAIDFAGLTARATRLLDDPTVRADEQGRYAHVLIDDYEAAGAASARLVGQLAELGAAVTITGNPPDALEWGRDADATVVELTHRFRDPVAPRVVICNHPAIEAEAIAGELLAARAGGQEWSDMAVLVRSARSARAGAIGRALRRHGIPVDSPAQSSGDEPAVQAIIDMLHRVADDAGDAGDAEDAAETADPKVAHLAALRDDLASMAAGATPADLAFEVWTRTLGHLAGDECDDDAALDAVVAFLAALQRRANRRPQERLAEFLAVTGGRPAGVRPTVAPPSGQQAVTISSIASAAGREWPTVVIAGCVEGELPNLRARARLFDPWLLGVTAPDDHQRRQIKLVEERRLFASGCDRATGHVIGTVGAEPGVLPSRFVESWATSEPQLVRPESRAALNHPRTVGIAPAIPDGHLRLSASQLSVYDDCPLRYAYQYVLGARSDAGVHAALGTLVHEALAEFLDPDSPDAGDLSHERLLAIAESLWRDDIAPYRPQVEEVRRDYFSMLNDWWTVEGGGSPMCPEVLGVERKFEIEVGPHTVTGSIDRIDRADDGEGLRVVDYKTGRTTPNADQVAANIQLAVYHLAASRDPGLVALGAPSQLRLLFVREMKAFEQTVTPDHAAATEERILATAELILDEQFAPSIDADCRTCSFHRLCPLQDQGRQVAV